MAEVIPIKATKSGGTPTGLGEFESGDTLPDATMPATVARISGATTIAVVASLPTTPDANTIYLVTG
mgnify:CR=1 FL=1